MGESNYPDKQKFSMGCVLSIGIKCVEAIEELHTMIFVLHRDIKPGIWGTGKVSSPVNSFSPFLSVGVLRK